MVTHELHTLCTPLSHHVSSSSAVIFLVLHQTCSPVAMMKLTAFSIIMIIIMIIIIAFKGAI